MKTFLLILAANTIGPPKQPPGDNIPWWVWLILPPLLLAGMALMSAISRGKRW